MRWGLIGFGSIGKRHSQNIQSFGDDVFAVTRNDDCTLQKSNTIEDLIARFNPDLVLISNETSLHRKAYQDIRMISADLPILIEKPIFDKKIDILNDDKAYVAYCLRFHPLVIKLKERVEGKSIISARFYVGQYLPTWRAGRDYRETYSAKIELGGGVLRDLSHEIDLAYHLLGDLDLVFSKSDKISNLEITSDDYFFGFFQSSKCRNITIEMNYLDRINQRFLIIMTNEETIKVDFIAGEIIKNETVEKIVFDKNDMYLNMIKLMREKKYLDLSSFKDGLKILEIISQVESSRKI